MQPGSDTDKLVFTYSSFGHGEDGAFGGDPELTVHRQADTLHRHKQQRSYINDALMYYTCRPHHDTTVSPANKYSSTHMY